MNMPRWKLSCDYEGGKYPVIALIDLFFLLLLLFVLSNSMLFLPGVLITTNAGQIEEADDAQDTAVMTQNKDFSDYIHADKIVLTLDDAGNLELNTKHVTMDTLDNALSDAADSFFKMYTNANHINADAEVRKNYRPKLVLCVSSQASVEKLEAVLEKIRNKHMDIVFKMSRIPE